jgi:hypothetical protein
MSPNKNKQRDADRVLHMAEAARWITSHTISLTIDNLLLDKMM